MALSEKMASLWRNIVLFGQALDHDPQSEMAQEIDRLVAAQNSDRAAFTAIASRVDALAAEVRGLSERVGRAR
ncbi:hypothetical protein [Sphingopyxis sp. GW247-27LB]|uniref:hypothetical protein n=1 Tax=Sphingopyxis sp. GW247-27LB TaxID=2012632 RepID=UPI000BA70D4D|nr:hypothetical protein [Sphingopyxis sp. GW247-27LB]PAL20006.1 hypothetical protein CD928_19235 [Sphingopyxis sp. GW247-27LB]